MSGAISSITSALPSLGKARLLINSADDVVIVSAVRTAVTRVIINREKKTQQSNH